MKAHYHIRWSSKPELDWERHDSYSTAEKSANQLLREGETYTIEEHDDGCQRCRAALKRPSREKLKYSWQRAVFEAFESGPESLAGKINAAERAIATRLRDESDASLDEQLALKNALRSLNDLLPGGRRFGSADGKRDIA